MEPSLLNQWFTACEKGQLSTLAGMVAHGVCVNAASTSGRRALPYACRGADLALAKALLKLGADPNHRASTGWTPLMGAACRASRDTSMIDMLLSAGADLFACAVEDGEVLDPLCAALAHGKPHAVERLSRAVQETLAAGTVPAGVATPASLRL